MQIYMDMRVFFLISCLGGRALQSIKEFVAAFRHSYGFPFLPAGREESKTHKSDAKTSGFKNHQAKRRKIRFIYFLVSKSLECIHIMLQSYFQHSRGFNLKTEKDLYQLPQFQGVLRLQLRKADRIMRNGTGSDKTSLPPPYWLLFSESYPIVLRENQNQEEYFFQ